MIVPLCLTSRLPVMKGENVSIALLVSALISSTRTYKGLAERFTLIICVVSEYVFP